MPHDSRGVELKVGDRVVLIGKVASVTPNETMCNLNVVIEDDANAAPDETYRPSVSMNSKLATKEQTC